MIIRQYNGRDTGTIESKIFQLFKPHTTVNRYTRCSKSGGSSLGFWDKENLKKDKLNFYAMCSLYLELVYN